MVGWSVRGAVVLGVALAAGVAAADPTPTELAAARDLFSKAEKDEDAGQWSAALEKLRRAASVKVTPGIRFHIALCEEKVNQLVLALADYVAADQAAREQNNKDVMEAVAEPLRLLRIRVPTQTLEDPATAGAVVEVEGKANAPGLYGVAIPVEPGSHVVRAHAEGKEPFTATVQLSERDAITTTVKWRATVVATAPVETPPPGESTGESSSTSVRWGAIIASVSAAALLGFGIGAYMAADGAQTTLYQECPTMPDCSGLKTPVRTWDAVALGSWIAAAGTATLAIVLWVKPSHKGTSARLELRPMGAALTGRF